MRGDEDEEGDVSGAGDDIDWEWNGELDDEEEGEEEDGEDNDAGYGNSPIPAAWGLVVERLMLGKVEPERGAQVEKDDEDE